MYMFITSQMVYNAVGTESEDKGKLDESVDKLKLVRQDRID